VSNTTNPSPATRKLIVQQWVTVDNIAAEEDGGLSFVSGEPFDDEVTGSVAVGTSATHALPAR
jgi:hypothetical protein